MQALFLASRTPPSLREGAEKVNCFFLRKTNRMTYLGNNRSFDPNTHLLQAHTQTAKIIELRIGHLKS